MKKFFKALALVLALTLVIGSIPAAAADVTITPIEKKTLYAGGSKGLDNNGKQSSYKSRVTYAKMLGITKKQAKKLKVTAVSSDSEIVAVNNKSKAARAYGIGTVTITLTANKKDYKVTITSKKSAEKILFGQDWANLPEGDTFEAELNKEYVISVPRSQASKKIDTDERDLRCDDESVSIKPFLDENGKEVARKYIVTFTKAGEFKVTAGAYQSKKSYPVLHTTRTVTVTVKAVDFEATQKHAKVIEVAGSGFTKDTEFTLIRGKSTPVSFTKTVNAEGTLATLTLEQKIVADNYTVTEKASGKVSSFKGEAQTIAVFEVLENGGTVNKSDDGLHVYAHFQMLDQWNDPCHKDFTVTWSTGTGSSVNSDTSGEKEGLLTINYKKGNEVKSGNIVSVTGVNVKTGKSCFGQMTVGLNIAASTVDILGIVKKDDLTTSTEAKINAGFKSNEYGIYMNLLDANGRELKYDDKRAEEIYVINESPLVVDLDSELESITIGGKTYAYAPIKVPNTGLNNNVGGVAKIQFISGKTGEKKVYELTVVAKGTLTTFEITGAKEVISESKKTELEFVATDENGTKLTKFRDIAPYITVSTNGLVLDEAENGDAVLSYEAKDDVATEDVDGHDSLTVIVQGGQVSPYAVEIRNARYSQKIKVINNAPENLVLGNGATIALADPGYGASFHYYDQYGQTIKKMDPDNDPANNSPVNHTKDQLYNLVSWFDGQDTAVSQNGTALTDGDTTLGAQFAYYDPNANNKLAYADNGNAFIKIEGNKISTGLGVGSDGLGTGINETFSAKIWFALAYTDKDGKLQIVSDSKIALTLTAWSIADVANFKLNYTGQFYDGKGNRTALTTADSNHEFKFTVVGTTSNGKNVDIPDIYSTLQIAEKKYLDQVIVTPSAIFTSFNDWYKFDGVNHFSAQKGITVKDGNNVERSPFINYQRVGTDGQFESQAVMVKYIAKVYNVSPVSIGGVVYNNHTTQRGTDFTNEIPLWDRAAKKNVNVTFKDQNGLGWSPYAVFSGDGNIVGENMIWAVDADKKAKIQAWNGFIDVTALKRVLNTTVDEWGYETPIGAWTISISGLTESKDGLHSDIIDKKALKLDDFGDIINAETGDTFVATMAGDDQKVEITFTVIDDLEAWVGTSTNGQKSNTMKINGWM